MRERLSLLPLLCTTLICLAYVCSPRLLSSQTTSGSIVGQIRIAPGLEIKAPVLVTLSTRGATVNSVYTDNEGRFGFNGLPGNLYHISINEEGYLPVQDDLSVDPVNSSMRVLNIYLVPRETNAKSSPSIKGSNTHLADSSQLNQNIPKSARKEYDKAVNADGAGKTNEAIRHYAKAVELAPEYYEARNNLGSAYLAKSQFQQAQDQFEKVIQSNPSDAAAYFNLANLYLLKSQYSQSEGWVEKGLRREPDSAFGHFLEGSLCSRTGRPSEAESSLRRALELDPFMSKAHLALVNLYLQQKRDKDAAAELRLFLKNFPEDPFAPKAKQVLQKLEAVTGKINP
jgi:predicted Zn-dependent protease